MLKLDYSYMMADVVGSRCGIAEVEISAEEERVLNIHRQLQASRAAGKLPFFDLPAQDVEEIVVLADSIADRFDDLVVLGIGGSALGTRAIARALLPLHHNLFSPEQRNGRPRLFIMDNVDPVGINATLELMRPERTCFCVISKSGTTVETMSQFLIARDWVENAVGESFRNHFVLITDPEKGVLRKLATEQGYRSAVVPDGVGGRFSVFTAVGLLPLAVAGVDIRSLLAGAAAIAPHLDKADLTENPAYLNGLLQYLTYRKGAHISVMMPYSDQLSEVADWYCQLWAESLGKMNDLDGKVVNVGPSPVKALGSTDQHSQLQLYMEGPFDKVVTFIGTNDSEDLSIPGATDIPDLAYLGGQTLSKLLQSEQRATAIALARAERPNCTIMLDGVNPRSVGALLFMLEVQTVFTGALFNVDPLDQPGVEAGKVITSALMGRSGFSDRLEEVEKWENIGNLKVLEVG
jgi:glucose-6-phosphate isomerase